MPFPILVGGIDEVRPEPIREQLAAHRYAIVRGVASPDEIREAMARAAAAFCAADDHAVVGESPEEVRRLFQKWSIGMSGGPHRTYSYARFARVIFTPFLDRDKYGLHDLLRRVAVVRNRLLGVPDGYAIDTIEDGLWTAARLQQYPRGAGFIGAHADTVVVNATPGGPDNYVQVVLAMTERGTDFERGGAFIEHDGRRVDLEAQVQLGDLLVYDQRSVHGVADIDPHRVFDPVHLTGRVVGLTNLYRVM